MDNPHNKDGHIIILSEEKQTERPKLLDAYGAEIEPEEEPYIPCLDGTDQCPPRNRIVRSDELGVRN